MNVTLAKTPNSWTVTWVLKLTSRGGGAARRKSIVPAETKSEIILRAMLPI
jgi:hypothetical protein